MSSFEWDGLVIVTGEPYPDPSVVENEGVGWHSNGRQHHILAALDRPRKEEIDGLSGNYAVAFCLFDDILFPLINPAPGWWIEMAWAPLDTEDAEYLLPQWEAGEHQLILQTIVDSSTGVVVRQRAFTLSPHTSEALSRAVTSLIQKPHLAPVEYMQRVMRIRARFPQTIDMLPHAIVRSRPGD